MLEYNTARSRLIIKEYGRNVHRMIAIAQQQTDPVLKQKAANTIVELMAFLNHANKNLEDFKNKLWDHLFVISEFNLDVKSPYPIPTKESTEEKPERIAYPKRNPKFLHLGKNIEYLMDKATNEKDEFTKQYLTQIVMNYMRIAYNTWHKDNAQEETLKTELRILSKGHLIYESNPAIKQILKDQRGDIDINKIPRNNHSNNNNNKKNNNKNHKHNNRFSRKNNYR